MRLLALEQTSTRTRVGYRWLGDPFAPMRLLIDAPALPLDGLRSTLEHAILGEPLRPDQYRIVTADPESLAVVSDAFGGFSVDLVRELPLERLLFAAAPLTYPEVIEAVERFLAPFATMPSTAQAAIDPLRRAQIAVIGQARRARLQTVALLGEVHLSLTSLDPDQTLGAETNGALILTLVSACTDPGVSAREAVFFDKPDTALVVHRGSAGDGAETIPMADIKARWPALPVIRADSGDLLRTYVQQQLIDALQRWCEDAFGLPNIDPRIEQRVTNAYQCFKELII